MNGSNLELTPGSLRRCQIHLLMEVLHLAFVFLRSPGYRYFYRDRSFYDLELLCRIRDRSVAFGEALHNLPDLLLTGRLNVQWLREGIVDIGMNGPPHARSSSHRPFRDLLYLGRLVEEAEQAGDLSSRGADFQ